LGPFQDLPKLFQAVLNRIEIVSGHLRPFKAVVWSFLAVSDVFGAVLHLYWVVLFFTGRFGLLPIISGHTEVVLRLF
jgi:hypothetical protein